MKLCVEGGVSEAVVSLYCIFILFSHAQVRLKQKGVRQASLFGRTGAGSAYHRLWTVTW